MERKRFTSVISVLVIVIITGAVGYFVLMKKLAPTIQQTPAPTQAPVTRQSAPVPQTPSGETANWKTYRNEKYGFEIKYPQDWISLTGNVNPQKYENRILGLWTRQNYKTTNSLYSYTDPSILIDIAPNPSGEDIEKYLVELSKSRGFEFGESPKKMTLDNGLSVWLTVLPGLGDGDQNIFIPSPFDKKFFIEIYVPWSYPNDDLILKSAVNSFRFIQ